jgi:hypothetical protein
MELNNSLQNFADQIESRLNDEYEDYYDLEKQYNAGNLDLIVVVSEEYDKSESISSIISDYVSLDDDVRIVAEKNGIENDDTGEEKESFSGRSSVSDKARNYLKRTEFYIRKF